MQDYMEHLRELELTSVPDLKTLQSSFKRLIKLYHPDVNLERKEWAHARSQRVINSFHFLKERIQSGALKPQTQFQFRQHRTPEPQERPNAAAQQSETVRSRSTANAEEENNALKYYQLIRDTEHGYAVPVEKIVRILSFSDPAVKKNFVGYYCKYAKEIFPIVSIDGKSVIHNPASFVILMNDLNTSIGLYIPHRMEFMDISGFHESEFLIHRLSDDSKNRWLMYKEIPFCLPHDIIQATAARNRTDRQKYHTA